LAKTTQALAKVQILSKDEASREKKDLELAAEEAEPRLVMDSMGGVDAWTGDGMVVGGGVT
jgi:hypothetical protein